MSRTIRNNPVAKHDFNRAKTHRDKRNDYQRKPKHPRRDLHQ